ncbi:hypothetical protein [Massilia mucilaginosa]|uniref:hypothetical protein n=1 Tax=Massilia mucilaginosa TaxID=2609282 RepID=UPI001651BF5C|nr:hypothetical protein [Massilia mucilaginosa]
MATQVTTCWTVLDGALVFEAAFTPGDGLLMPTVCVFVAGAREDLVTVRVRSAPDASALQFASLKGGGCHARGTLKAYAGVHIDGVPHAGVFADLYYGHVGAPLEQHYEGFIGLVPQEGPPGPAPLPPPEPWPWPPEPEPYPEPEPEPEPDPEHPYPARVDGVSGELFPYMYVRKWPSIDAADLARGFVRYAEAAYGSPPPSTFYDDLCRLRARGRVAMQDAALAFIDGAAPYAGQFVASAAQEPLPLSQVAGLAAALARDPAALQAALLRRFGVATPAAMRALLSGAQASAFLDRVWLSYFALVIILGYRRALLDQLHGLLVGAHLLGQAFAQPAMPASATLRALMAATVVLPDPVFPLPPAESSPPAAVPDNGWIAPYAIGDLQMVRQRLLRHEPGEIAHIENVMRGERKEVTRRRMQRQLEHQSHDSERSDSLDNEASDGRDALLEETRHAIAEKTLTNQYDNFQTTYGPPADATLSGSWTESTQQGPNRGIDDVTRFARAILERSVGRIARKVGQSRSSSMLNETEERVGSTIDNSAGSASVVGVYRWLNKVFEARVVHYGTRLMVEFMLRDPAAAYLLEQQGRTGTRAGVPLSLDDNGIASFADVNPGNYARLAALYEVTEISPPPASPVLVSASLRGGQERLVALAPGYCAAAAHVNVAPGAPAPPVLVGREVFRAGDPPDQGRVFGESDAIALAVGSAPLGSPPCSAMEVLVNVVIECYPGAALLDGWRIQTYAALLAGYRRQVSRFDELAGGAGARADTRAPQAERLVERKQLRRGCIGLLFERYAALAGSEKPCGRPSVFSVNEAHYLQFFDELFEWDEMTWRFHTRPAAGAAARAGLAPAGDALSPFIEADSAMVMLPVRPGRVMALLYFLSSGALWDGDNRLAPASSADIALINDLKSAEAHAHAAPRPVGRPWELVVPTAMQVIDGAVAAWSTP